MHCRVLPECSGAGQNAPCTAQCISSAGLLNLHGWVLREMGVECSMHGECSRRNLPTVPSHGRVLPGRSKMHGRVLTWRLKLHGRVLPAKFNHHRTEQCSQGDSKCMEECSRRNFTTIARKSDPNGTHNAWKSAPGVISLPSQGRVLPVYLKCTVECSQRARVLLEMGGKGAPCPRTDKSALSGLRTHDRVLPS